MRLLLRITAVKTSGVFWGPLYGAKGRLDKRSVVWAVLFVQMIVAYRLSYAGVGLGCVRPVYAASRHPASTAISAPGPRAVSSQRALWCGRSSNSKTFPFGVVKTASAAGLSQATRKWTCGARPTPAIALCFRKEKSGCSRDSGTSSAGRAGSREKGRQSKECLLYAANLT